jgi:aldehyde:ferredoxin oxidoreductase
MYGWSGKTVTVDLTDGKITENKIDPNILRSFIGGRGLGVKLYYDSVSPELDPLSPENPLIFATGPLTGTAAPLSGRHAMVTRSPLTRTIFNSSAGGFFGKELKFAGIDALIIKGRAQEPVYLSIKNDDISILKADKLWGKNVRECTDILKPEGSAACIGRAGEKLVPIANIMNDYIHACGRGGLGAVMGSKMLKAVVVKGSTKPEIADEAAFAKARDEALRQLYEGPMRSKSLSTYGTSSLMNLINYNKMLPTQNFRKSEFTDADKVSGEFMKENYEIRNHACYNCIIACKHIIKSGAFEGHEIPEYETLWAFGPDNNNADMDEIIRANRMCNEYGIDTISSGSTIAAYAELMGKDFNDLAGLVRKIGEKEDVGAELGKGSKSLNEVWHACHTSLRPPDTQIGIAMHSKGLELPAYDPRGVYGQALSYATSNRGGCHLRGYMIPREVFGKPVKIERKSFTGKTGLLICSQNENAVMDSLVLCIFAWLYIPVTEFAGLLSAATGIDYTLPEFKKCGERMWNLERMFNNSAGFSREDDSLPERFFGSGGINRDEFEKSLDEYYILRGWDENGVPTPEKLKELGL